MEELSQFKERCNEKNIRINQLEKQQTMENERLISVIAEQIMLENTELKRLLTDHDAEIIRLIEQLKNLSKEFEQRISKLKIDFRIMYEKQSTFFLEKLALLKDEEQR
jgi:septal ring factor EnvC (AmiA/AmiB activator)